MNRIGLILGIFLGGIMALSGGSDWVQVNPTITPKDFYGIEYANGNWVLLTGGGIEYGAMPELFSSQDLQHFVSSGEFEDAWETTNNNLVYGHAGFMVGAGHTVLVSSDGVKWKTYSFPNINISTLAYGNGYYVGVSPSFTSPMLVFVSTDGAKWKTYTFPLPSADIVNVFYADGSFWFYGFEGSPQALTTEDFVNWNQVVLDGVSSEYGGVLTMVNMGDAKIIAGYINNTSTGQMLFFDVSTISSPSLLSSWIFNYEDYEYGPFYAYGNGMALMYAGYWTVTKDFINFQNYTIPDSITPRLVDVKFVNGEFFIIGVEGLIASLNAGKWSVVNEGLVGTIGGVVFNEDVFSLALSGDAANTTGIYSSPDGANWKNVVSGIEVGNYQYSPSQKLYYGFSGSSIVSLNSLKGPVNTINTAFEAEYVGVGNGVWIATQTSISRFTLSGHVYTSDLSGQSWSTTFQNTIYCGECYGTQYFVSVVFFSGKFYIPSNAAGTMLVGDGQNWSSEPIPCNVGSMMTANNVLYTNCFDLQGTYTQASTDGLTWKNVTGLSSALSSVTYSPSLAQYIATVGTYTARSNDGEKWRVSDTPIKATLSEVSTVAVAHGNHRTVVLATIANAQNNVFVDNDSL